MDRPDSKCSEEGCDSKVVAWFPAFDRNVAPEPYCQRHLDIARATMVLEGPHFVNMAKKRQGNFVHV